MKHQNTKAYNVQPLRKKADILAMYQALGQQGQDSETTGRIGQRNKTLFEFGINTGLRVSDIIKLKVKDVKGKDRYLTLEKKTGKKRTVYLANIKNDLSKYIQFMKLKDSDWLFPSRKHGFHISESQVYKALVEAGEMIDHHDIGTHTMRKTFGYWYIQDGGRIEDLMVIFNHSSPVITKRYIGIQQDDIEHTLKGFKL